MMDTMDREILKERRKYNTRKKLETSRAWSCNADGSAEPQVVAWNSIFEAWIDYKRSLAWN